MLNQQIL